MDNVDAKPVKVSMDILFKIFDFVTLDSDFDTRQKLLTCAEIRDYSKSVQHMRILFKKWHFIGCHFLRNRLLRTLPETMSKEWLNHVAARVKESCKHEKPSVRYNYSSFASCPLCDRLLFCCVTM